MSWKPRKVMVVVIVLTGGLLWSGCAAPSRYQYKNPYSQEESSRTYRELYPEPFTLDQGPSGTSSGDD
jgi:hypothetical protein